MSEALKARTLTDDELQEQLEALSREQLNLRFQKVNGELASTARVRVVRRSIARVKTELRRRAGGGVMDTAPVVSKKAAAPKTTVKAVPKATAKAEKAASPSTKVSKTPKASATKTTSTRAPKASGTKASPRKAPRAPAKKG